MQIGHSHLKLISPSWVFATILVSPGLELSSTHFHNAVGVHLAESLSVTEETTLAYFDLEHASYLDL